MLSLTPFSITWAFSNPILWPNIFQPTQLYIYIDGPKPFSRVLTTTPHSPAMSNERRPPPSAKSNIVVIDLTDEDDSKPPITNELVPSVAATSSSLFSTGYGTIVAGSASAAVASTVYTNALYETHMAANSSAFPPQSVPSLYSTVTSLPLPNVVGNRAANSSALVSGPSLFATAATLPNVVGNSAANSSLVSDLPQQPFHGGRHLLPLHIQLDSYVFDPNTHAAYSKKLTKDQKSGLNDALLEIGNDLDLILSQDKYRRMFAGVAKQTLRDRISTLAKHYKDIGIDPLFKKRDRDDFLGGRLVRPWRPWQLQPGEGSSTMGRQQPPPAAVQPPPAAVQPPPAAVQPPPAAVQPPPAAVQPPPAAVQPPPAAVQPPPAEVQPPPAAVQPPPAAVQPPPAAVQPPPAAVLPLSAEEMRNIARTEFSVLFDEKMGQYLRRNPPEH